MRLFGLAMAAAALAFNGGVAVADNGSGGDNDDDDDHGARHHHDMAMHDGGPMAAACKDLKDGDQCKVVHHRPKFLHADGEDQGAEPELEEEVNIGVCQTMVEGEVHCHILHPSAVVCLNKDEGTACKFKHRGLDEEETGECEKMPHGMVCQPKHDDEEQARRHHGGHMEQFTSACKDKASGDTCSLDLPDGTENQFAGVCESPFDHRHHHGDDDEANKRKISKQQYADSLRCRMLSPMEAACVDRTEGDDCNITLHAHGSKVSRARRRRLHNDVPDR